MYHVPHIFGIPLPLLSPGPATMIPLDWCAASANTDDGHQKPYRYMITYESYMIYIYIYICHIYIYNMSWLWRSHPHISQPLIHICLKNMNPIPVNHSFPQHLKKLDPNCAPCCVQPPRHGEPRRFRAPGDSPAPPGQRRGSGVLRTSSGFSAMGHGMVINSYGDGSKPWYPWWTSK